MSDWFCDLCNKGGSGAGRVGHERSKAHKARVEGAVPPSVPFLPDSGLTEPVVTISKGQPAILADWYQLPNPKFGGREIKMLRPVCRTCEGRFGWWLTCPHDPYVSMAEIREQLPEWGPDLPDGRKQQVGWKTAVAYRPVPNRTQVSLSLKVSSGSTVETKRRTAGFIFPSELRSPHFPNGIAEACQWRGCFYQIGLKPYGSDGSVGTFCREEEAGLALFHEDAPAQGELLASGFDRNSARKRQQQLRAAVANA